MTAPSEYVKFVLATCAIAYGYYTWRTKIPLIPTQKAARDEIIKIIGDEMKRREQVNQSDKIKIYDLGSGLGGLCVKIAEAFPRAEVTGFEMAWPAWLYSYLRAKLGRYPNLRFRYRNFWKTDIGDGDIVIFYLGDVVMKAMAEKLRKEAKADRLILSNTFPLPDNWQPLFCARIDAAVSKQIVVYRQ